MMSCEHWLRIYGGPDEVLINALGRYDTDAQVMANSVKFLFDTVVIRHTQDEFRSFMDEFKQDPPLSDEVLKEKWTADHEGRISNVDFELILAIHRLRTDPDITPRQQVQAAQELVAKEKSKLKSRLKEAKKKTALLSPTN
jgi:hypothetical protein